MQQETMANLVNTSVFCRTSKTTILPWTIVQFESSHTIRDFFDTAIKPRLSYIDCTLLSALVGPDKSSLDSVDISITLLPVINSFGRFLKYCVDGEHLSNPETLQSDTEGDAGQVWKQPGFWPLLELET